MQQKILVVEDEPTISENIRYALSTEGFAIECFATGNEALAALSRERFSLAVVDVGLPDMTGFDLCREVRKHHNLPLLFLTARSGEIDRVVGLEIGGDDYITKPFSPRELVARIRAVLRRTEPTPRPAEGELRIVEEQYTATYKGVRLDLTRSEFFILKALVSQPARVLTREQLMGRISDEPQMTLERTIDSHIKSLRAKLKSVGADPEIIVTHRGIGYSYKGID